MPKAVQYNKDAVIYFEGDIDYRIFILQKGVIALSSAQFEIAGGSVASLNAGEFFGVKNALGHFPREETATVLQDSSVISMTVAEFEGIFSKKKDVVYKMLKIFSGQLRELHRKTKTLMSMVFDLNQKDGILAVAKSFFESKNYRACVDVCEKFMRLFPDCKEHASVLRLKDAAIMQNKRLESLDAAPKTQSAYSVSSNVLVHFMLPAFERFQKKYEAGQVIICEFEPGDSFYLIQSGEVRLVKCMNGVTKNLDILKAGEFFGEMAILDNSPRSATCMAVSDVQCLEFNKQNFEILVAGNPQIAIILLKLFCKRIFDQKRRLKILSIDDNQVRLADVFCMLDEMNLSIRLDEKSHRFNVTIQDISGWAGLSKEIVQDELEKFSAKNKIQIFEEHVIITNMKEMQRLVDSWFAQKKQRGQN